jgi:hypothetical protein
MKKTANFRLSDKARRLLVLLGEKLGISKTAVLEMAVRRLDEQLRKEDARK